MTRPLANIPANRQPTYKLEMMELIAISPVHAVENSKEGDIAYPSV
jgi:hypothetical protein